MKNLIGYDLLYRIAGSNFPDWVYSPPPPKRKLLGLPPLCFGGRDFLLIFSFILSVQFFPFWALMGTHVPYVPPPYQPHLNNTSIRTFTLARLICSSIHGFWTCARAVKQSERGRNLRKSPFWRGCAHYRCHFPRIQINFQGDNHLSVQDLSKI